MAPVTHRRLHSRKPRDVASWQKHAMPSDLVNYESPSMSVAAGSQSQNLAVATVRRRFSSPAHSSIDGNLRCDGIGKHAVCKITKPLITRGRPRPGLSAPTASAQNHHVTPYASTLHTTPIRLSKNVRAPTLPLHPDPYGGPMDFVPHTTCFVGSSQQNMHSPLPQALQRAGV
jgi:hypothetical protein